MPDSDEYQQAPAPILYERYDLEQIIGLFGSDGDAPRYVGRWLLFRNVSICLMNVGPEKSIFLTANRFRWVNEEPLRPLILTDTFLPDEVIAQGAKGRKQFLFARYEEDSGVDRYRFLGETEPTYAYSTNRTARQCSADFEILTPLPSQILSESMGTDFGDQDHQRLDAHLDRLHHLITFEERFEVLQHVVEYFHGPIRPEDGFSEEELHGIAMPHALHCWYRWAGKRTEAMSGFNYLKFPRCTKEGYYDGLYMKDDRLMFYTENQYCHQWSTFPEGEDPPVYERREDSESWSTEGMRVSEHLILACIFEAMCSHLNYGAQSIQHPNARELLRELANHIRPLPIAPWEWGQEMRFYASGGVFMHTMAYSGIYVASKTEAPLAFLKPMIDESWDSVAF